MRNILLTIEYDGTNFCGWQRQPGRRTVQGELEKVLSVICGRDIKISGTSRTDAGVHAYGQRASFQGDFGIPTDRIMPAANNLLSGGRNALDSAGDVRIVKVEEVPADFHARFDAKGKTYFYKIHNCRIPPSGDFTAGVDIFRRNYCYQLQRHLDVEAMKKAAKYMEGTHDFKCFQASGGEEKKTTVRTIFDLRVICGGAEGRDIEIQVTGDGFLYNMVRIITGTLVDVGLGKIAPKTITDILRSCDRRMAGHTAPPQGLYLAEVYFDEKDRGYFVEAGRMDDCTGGDMMV